MIGAQHTHFIEVDDKYYLTFNVPITETKENRHNIHFTQAQIQRLGIPTLNDNEKTLKRHGHFLFMIMLQKKGTTGSGYISTSVF